MINPTVVLLFIISYNVVQEVISSFSRNDNIEEFPISVLFVAIPKADGSTTIPFPFNNMLQTASDTIINNNY